MDRDLAKDSPVRAPRPPGARPPLGAVRSAVRADWAVLRAWDRPQWRFAALSAVATAVLAGVPTGVLATGLYSRPIPVPWWAYPLWAVSAVLIGLLLTTILGPDARADDAGKRRAVGGGFLSLVAIGCPTCNAFAVLALGSGGALSVFAPVQPVLGVAALALLLVAVHRRLQPAVCPLPTPPGTPVP